MHNLPVLLMNFAKMHSWWVWEEM